MQKNNKKKQNFSPQREELKFGLMFLMVLTEACPTISELLLGSNIVYGLFLNSELQWPVTIKTNLGEQTLNSK